MRTLHSFLLLFLTAAIALSQTPNTDKNNIALEGYDPVSYFEGKPQKGSTKITDEIEGVIYRFSSAENCAKFQSNPLKYLPQYGGYCAYAMAKDGDEVGINPKSYLIIDDKLYLFYDSWGIDTRKKWLKDDSAKQIEAADKYWAAKRQ